MKIRVAIAIACLALAACASMGGNDSERRFTGVVEGSQKISRAGEPPRALMAFGLVGGLVSSAASGPTPTNLYRVRVSDELFTAQTDEDYTVGSCVDIIPAKDAIIGRAYAYGQARIVASDKCSQATTSK
jgi:hypothetical protein